MADRRLERLLLIERWPTREEAASALWFSPVRLGPLLVRERTWVPAMVPWRATEEGEVTDAVIDWYARFARGRPGAIVVEATGIRDVPSGPLLRIGHDRYLPGLRRLVDAVREASGGETRLLIQLIDFLAIRRRPEKEKFFARFLSVDEELRAAIAAADRADSLHDAEEPDLRRLLATLPDDELRLLLPARVWESYAMGHRERVTDLQLPWIRDLPRVLPGLFAAAASRAREAGFDGAELHFAHAYTMASFLSARNTRTDGYGGSREDRVRLPLEVFAAVRQAVGGDWAVGCRLLGDEVIEGGSGIEDASFFSARFASAGFDFLSVSKGGKFEDARQPKVGASAYPYTGPSGQECMPTVHLEGGPFGRNVHLAASIRRAVREAGFDTKIVTAGGISSLEQAEAILAAGAADLVASARQTLADPDWFAKLRAGRGAEIRRCFFTNYCEALDQAHKEVTCQRWDRLFPPGEEKVALARDGRRRLVPPID